MVLCLNGAVGCTGCDSCRENVVVYTCSGCEEPIFDGQDCFNVCGDHYCDECVNTETAESEDW